MAAIDVEAPLPVSPGPPDGVQPLGLSNQRTMAYQTLDPAQFQQLARRRLRRRLALSTVSGIAIAAVVCISTMLLARAPLAPDAFRYHTYDQIVGRLHALESAYPQFVEVFSAQERYGLPLRDELQCTRNGTSVPCEHYVVKITDRASLPDAARPEIFFSGALHGDERVGPQAALALAELLAQNAANASGIEWIQRLVKTRTIVIMPTTNAYGYDHNTRQEKGVDPNRDFPYLRGGRSCFQSMTARAVNEVWRHHLFQLAVTWHGGMRAVSYEWGSLNHVVGGASDEMGSHVSPDDRAQFLVATGMARYGGTSEDDGAYYGTGRMNDIVYAVAGGMEDWAYAASWENELSPSGPVLQCEPTTYGGYDKHKSEYSNATHRAFNILIETSDDKEPDEYSLGTPAALSEQALAHFLPANESIGHVPRNVRLALFYIDLLEPYVVWTQHPEEETNATRAVGDNVTFTWEVAGAITVDRTQLTVSPNADLSNATIVTASQSGVTRWYHPAMGDISIHRRNNKGVFSQTVQFPHAGVYYVQASATVDQNWAEQPETPSPNVKPQTHIVNARTNDAWYYKANNKTVQGRTHWTSTVVRVVVQWPTVESEKLPIGLDGPKTFY